MTPIMVSLYLLISQHVFCVVIMELIVVGLINAHDGEHMIAHYFTKLLHKLFMVVFW